MSSRAFLHRLKLGAGTVELVPTNASLLRRASFIDGRTDFSTGPSRAVPLADFLAAMPSAKGPDRYIFHLAFGGSTLLSRLLDSPGYGLVLREPNCLADLANQRAAADREERVVDHFGECIGPVLRHLRRPWRSGEPVVVKPSNWANNLLPWLVAASDGMRPLLMTMDRRAYLLAVFRGGADRLAFAARAAIHLSAAGARGSRLIALALARTADPVGRLAGVVATLHQLQLDLFDDAERRCGWSKSHRLDHAELADDPRGAAARAAAALELDLPGGALDANLDRWLKRDSKQPARSYSARREQQLAIDALRLHGEQIEAALDWAAATF